MLQVTFKLYYATQKERNKHICKIEQNIFLESKQLFTLQEARFGGYSCQVCLLFGFKEGGYVNNNAANRSISSTTGCTITEKAPTRAFSWLKAATTAFTFHM